MGGSEPSEPGHQVTPGAVGLLPVPVGADVAARNAQLVLQFDHESLEALQRSPGRPFDLEVAQKADPYVCLLYTSPSPRD